MMKESAPTTTPDELTRWHDNMRAESIINTIYYQLSLPHPHPLALVELTQKSPEVEVMHKWICKYFARTLLDHPWAMESVSEVFENWVIPTLKTPKRSHLK
jgi:hypothetical protein